MIKILKNLSIKDWIYMALAIVFIVATVYFDLTLPSYMSRITTLVQTQGSPLTDVLAAGGNMLLCALGSLVASFIVTFFAAKVAASLSLNLRDKVFDKTLSFSMEELNHFSTASLITRSTNDITQVQMAIGMGMQSIVKAPILAILAIAKIMDKSWQWTAATGGAVVLLVLVMGSVHLYAIPRFKKIQTQIDSLNQVTRENLTGLQVIRAYNAEDYQEDKFEEANENLTSTNLKVNRVMAIMQPSMSLIMSALSLVIYIIGAFLINATGADDKLAIFSDMIVFSSYAVQVLMAFMLLIMVMVILPRAIVSANRINEILDTKPSIVDGINLNHDKEEKGTIEFRNVSFIYPESSGYALENISFTANQGETIAFIGATGSGKSTLINLIPRFYDVTEGEVLVNGINVKDYKQKDLRNLIGYVSQRATLFSGTLESNIAFGDNGKEKASQEGIALAIDIAQGKDFVDKKPEGYKAAVAQGGKNYSGGQKQRISIARAIRRNPQVLIFDDSFSALDYKTDKKLRNALKEKLSGVTKLIVAQRIGTIMDADKIIVLEDGRMVGKGSHSDLLATCKIYQDIALSQLSKEELKYA